MQSVVFFAVIHMSSDYFAHKAPAERDLAASTPVAATVISRAEECRRGWLSPVRDYHAGIAWPGDPDDLDWPNFFGFPR